MLLRVVIFDRQLLNIIAGFLVSFLRRFSTIINQIIIDGFLRRSLFVIINQHYHRLFSRVINKIITTMQFVRSEIIIRAFSFLVVVQHHERMMKINSLSSA